MSTRLYLVRHGATQLTAEDRFSGAVGVDLSDEGRRQVRRLAERLADDPIRAVYCSPLGRTVETAEILARPHGLGPVHRDGLREISHGRWEGLTRQEVEERFPDEYAAWEADPFTFAPRDGESGLAVLARALPVIREIVRRPSRRARHRRLPQGHDPPRALAACSASTRAATATASTSPRPASTSWTSRTRCGRVSCCSTTSPTIGGAVRGEREPLEVVGHGLGPLDAPGLMGSVV